MMREDFISFDNKDIDWGSILGEESGDDDVKPQITLKTIFMCPVCDKEYNSASGFRGHVQKGHGLSNVKASQHKRTIEVETVSKAKKEFQSDGNNSEERPMKSVKRKSPGAGFYKPQRMYTLDNLRQDMPSYILQTFETINCDENLAFEGSVHGNQVCELAGVLASNIRGGLAVDNNISEILCQKVWKTITAGDGMKTFASQSEEVWHSHFNLWVDEDVTEKLMSYFKTLIRVKYMDRHLFAMTRLFVYRLAVTARIQSEKTTSAENIDNATKLSKEELEALRYFAGYVPSTLLRKLQKKSKNSEYITMLNEMREVQDKQHDDKVPETKAWISKQDRGGLFHVTDVAFSLFVEIESVCKRHLTITKIGRASQNKVIHKPIIDEIHSSRQINSLWASVTRNTDNDDLSCQLFSMIVNLYVQVRCFSFSRSVVELHKTTNSLHVKGSKGLRKTLK
ncbi:uncharacterized protein [Ptychodera flava]|uniref:uncharacterized protein n=1 Tax=Ptychodera flava TaxID=63121 RepID=UPI00396A9519